MTFLQLSDTILMHIVKKMDIPDIASLDATNIYFNNFFKKNSVWEKLLNYHFVLRHPQSYREKFKKKYCAYEDKDFEDEPDMIQKYKKRKFNRKFIWNESIDISLAKNILASSTCNDFLFTQFMIDNYPKDFKKMF